MRRIFLALLICLLPLQSFAGGVMSAKMASMEVAMTAVQAPCHEVLQSVQAVNQDCCGSQAMCHAVCPVLMTLPFAVGLVGLPKQTNSPAALAASFQSADPRAGFKPPIP